MWTPDGTMGKPSGDNVEQPTTSKRLDRAGSSGSQRPEGSQQRGKVYDKLQFDKDRFRKLN